MKVNTRKFIYICIYICLIFYSSIALSCTNIFRVKCIIGTIAVSFGVIINILYVKKIFVPINIILICFILFQFGVPILYALFPEYDNWYVNQFSIEHLNDSVDISIISILFFSFGLIIINTKNKKKVSKFLSDENEKMIFSFSKLLLIVTGIVAIPLGVYVAYLGSTYGYNYVKEDTMNIYNGITRFAQKYVIVAIILSIIFAENNVLKKKYTIFAFIYAGILILSGARTVSLALILVLLFIYNENKTNKKSAAKTVFICVGMILILFTGVVVAQYRYSGEFVGFNILKILELVMQEMGFNFTTINFVKEFVPDIYPFRYGKTYINSIIGMIPKTLDITGTIAEINKSNPELELSIWLKNKYGNLYNFGVGYSIIAEAYYNFGKFAFISVFFQALIIGKLMNYSASNDDEKIKKYIQYILLFDLITYPRRSFFTLIKAIEYDIIIIIIVIYILSKTKRGEKNE